MNDGVCFLSNNRARIQGMGECKGKAVGSTVAACSKEKVQINDKDD